jgi:hypothetical protein
MRPHQILASELRNLGLTEMADEADQGTYHDFLSPFPMPELRLVRDLATIATKYPEKATEIMAIRRRVIDGEFDATTEESEEWAESQDGQDTFNKLIGRKKE